MNVEGKQGERREKVKVGIFHGTEAFSARQHAKVGAGSISRRLTPHIT